MNLYPVNLTLDMYSPHNISSLGLRVKSTLLIGAENAIWQKANTKNNIYIVLFILFYFNFKLPQMSCRFADAETTGV